MGRTANAIGTETCARIVRAAQRRLAERGPRELSIRDVASDAGISSSVVYYYFATKDALIEACIQPAYQELRMLTAELLRRMAETSSPATTIERGARIGVRYARQHREPLRLLQKGVIENGGLDEARSRTQLEPFLDAMTAWLAPRIAAPQVELRLRVQTMILLIARYALSSDAELAAVTSMAGVDAEQAVEDHLARLAVTLLCGAEAGLS